jgi:hypothetical protein
MQTMSSWSATAVLVCALGAVAVGSAPAGVPTERFPAAGTPVARNLVATPAVKAALRAAHLARVPRSDRAATRGPLKGTTYYGAVGSWRYALATFSHPRVGTTDQPELFSKAPGRTWRDRGDTGGCLSKGIIPRALLRLWHLSSNC